MSEAPVVLVTAAGRGIGAGIARHLAAQGHRLVLMSAAGGAERLAVELGAKGLTGSVTEPADVERAVAAALDAWGRIDGVVNNTGHAPVGELLGLTDGEWHAGLDMLLLNVVRMARAVTPAMERQGGGAIVNISSWVAVQPNPAFPVSSSLRAGLGAFTKLYAERYGARGIRMNNLLVGTTENRSPSADYVARIPLRRVGGMAEVAGAAAFLISPEAGYITGQNIRVDGGIGRPL